MPREGSNPMRSEQAPYKFKDVVLLVVTHLPSLTDYHEERFEIVKRCLISMRSGAKREHTFMIWDNGSCDELKEFLHNEFKPNVLVLSENIGKTAARAASIQMMPYGSIVAYSDDDILYFDDWLNPQIDLLNTLQGASVISGYPIRKMFGWSTSSAQAWAKKNNCQVQKGKFIPEEWERDYAASIGRPWEKHVDMTKDDYDYKIVHQGKKAFLTAHHCQFVGYVVNVTRALFQDGMAMGDEKKFDEALNKVGPRFCTTERLCRHMGNKMSEEFDIVKVVV